jgi:hypothetical protein
MEDLKDTMKLTGSVNVKLIGSDGKIKQEHTDHNLVVTVGKSYLASWLTAATQSGPFMSYIGLGTGTSGPAAGDTTLDTELSGGGYSRVQGTLSSASNTWSNTATFAPGNGTGAITEAGIFSASTVGTLFAHQVFAVYNKGAGDTMTIVWSVSFN